MPVSAEQWRAATGSLNAGKGSLRPRPSFKLSPHFRKFLPPSPDSWKGYYAAMVLQCTPLFYKMYLAGVSIMLYLVSGPGANILANSPYKLTTTGLTADISTSQLGGLPHLLFTTLNSLLYVAMVIAVVFFGIEEYRGREKHHWMLIQQLPQLELFLLSSGPHCEVIFDPKTRNVYATLSMSGLDRSRSVLKCVHTSCHISKKREKKNVRNVGHMIGVFLQLSTLVVVAMLLLQAGDVERNPGPIHDLDVTTLTRELSSAKDKWHEIGVQLEIELSQLSAIEDMYPTVDRRLSEMLGYWLDGNTKAPICWETILECLRASTVSKKGLAAELQQKYCCGQFDDGSATPTSLNRFRYQEATQSQSELSTEPRNSDPRTDSMAQLRFVKATKFTALMKEMEEKYQDLVDTISSSLERRNIPLKRVVARISTFGAFKPVFKGSQQPILQHRIPDLQEAEIVDEIMLIISDYSSFFNYLLVKRIIKALGTDEDHRKLEDYEKDFSQFAENTVTACSLASEKANHESQRTFWIKVDERFECYTFAELEEFRLKLSNILELSDEVLSLESIKIGCFELTFKIPSFVHDTLFPLSSQQEQEMVALGVTKISAGNYQYPPNQDKGDESDHYDVDKPDDGPDDGPSESGIGTALSTVFTELSELKQDMVSVDMDNPYEIDFDPKSQRHTKEASTETTTLLHVAALQGKLHHVKILVDTNEFKPLQKDQNGNTALHCAVKGNHLDVLKYFVEIGHCNPTVFSSYGETPLHLAARLGHLDIVEYLISDQGVDPMCEYEEDSITPLHAACIGGNLDIVQYVVTEFEKYLETGEIVRDKTKLGFTPLHFAAFYGHTEIVKFFITELNCDPNIPGPAGYKPLHGAAQEGHVDTMKYLIDSAKCNPSEENESKVTPLLFAAAYGKLEAVKLLLDRNCDPSCRAIDNNTPLHLASISGHLNIVKFFITALKCDPNVPGENGLTPLHVAAQGGHVDIMKYLIEDAKCNLLVIKLLLFTMLQHVDN